ncbi:uncharacterized protein LOC133834923 isoform X3 [Drosophila sulfurigaster albostrigata]|uniref:uncharacterized protein LOC133834923 isoform X3 n=1 Tax=Drosophila sulfurigaster albostrigata TaxID=89887 RepID=UPI002D2190DA|nr:uncharacterized protein LOC133834923 isoform X3 [Drosophila sulfurigaster albostrigata]
MDVWGVFVGDSTLSYGGSVRSGYYRDYEQFPYGTLEHSNTASPYPAKDSYSRVQGHKDGRLGKTRCNCEPTACKCIKKKQQQQQQRQRQQSLLLSQLRRRGADNLSSIILF